MLCGSLCGAGSFRKKGGGKKDRPSFVQGHVEGHREDRRKDSGRQEMLLTWPGTVKRARDWVWMPSLTRQETGHRAPFSSGLGFFHCKMG